MPKIKQLPSGSFHTTVYDYTDSNGKRHYKSITAESKREVKQLVAEFLANRDERQIVQSEKTLGEIVDNYIDLHANSFSPATIRGYRSTRRTHFQDLMTKPISKITSSDFQQAVDDMAKRLSAKTISDRYSLVRRSIEFEGIKTVYDVSIKAQKKTDIEIPTKQEILSLLESIKDTEIEVPVYLAALCGLRRSEVAGLMWQDIDFKKSLMRIHDAIVPNDKNEFVSRGNTKSYAGTRTIQVFDSVLNVLKKHAQPSGYVTNLNPNQIYKHYAKALKKSKIKHYKFHSLRHYCISVMLLLNIPKNYIADYVGHESESLIEKIYGHIMLEEKPAFFNRVDDFYNQMQNEMQNEKTQTQV